MAGKPITFPANPTALENMAPQALENVSDWEAAKAKAAAEETLEASDHTPGKPASFPASLTGQEHMADKAAENTADWGVKVPNDKAELAELMDTHAAAQDADALTAVADVEVPEPASAHLPPADFALPEAFYEHAGFEHASAHIPDHVADWLF